jgi:hypothetical protein
MTENDLDFISSETRIFADIPCFILDDSQFLTSHGSGTGTGICINVIWQSNFLSLASHCRLCKIATAENSETEFQTEEYLECFL